MLCRPEQYRSIIRVFTFQLIHNRHDMDNLLLPTSPSSRDMNDQLLDPQLPWLAFVFFYKNIVVCSVECREEYFFLVEIKIRQG